MMITGVALKLEDGTVVSLPKPNRHHHIIHQINDGAVVSRATQGFVDDAGDFLDRREALGAALFAGQIKRKKGVLSELFSEDLW
jgi:hypothetical protein